MQQQTEMIQKDDDAIFISDRIQNIKVRIGIMLFLLSLVFFLATYIINHPQTGAHFP